MISYLLYLAMMLLIAYCSANYYTNGRFIDPEVQKRIIDALIFLYVTCAPKIIRLKNTIFSNGATIGTDSLNIKYTFNGESYIAASLLTFGPRAIVEIEECLPSSAEDQEYTNITHKIRPYLGPYGNFHGIPTTPLMLGITNKIRVTYKNKEQKLYGSEDAISVRV
jgi:uncharacterized protein DUF5772